MSGWQSPPSLMIPSSMSVSRIPPDCFLGYGVAAVEVDRLPFLDQSGSPDLGYAYDSSFQDDDLPYSLKADGGEAMVEAVQNEILINATLWSIPA